MHDATNKRQTTQKKEKKRKRKVGQTQNVVENHPNRKLEKGMQIPILFKTEERQRANGPQTGVVHKPVRWRRCRASSK